MVIVFGANSELGGALVRRLLEITEYSLLSTFKTDGLFLSRLDIAANRDPAKYANQIDLEQWRAVAKFTQRIGSIANVWAAVNHVEVAILGVVNGAVGDRVLEAICANLLRAMNSI
jgi:dTDP-4-dehydrorhamnose reductase